jgi:Rrf2 family protein
MAANCRFAFAVHVLAVLAYKRGEEVSSTQLAASVNTNPVTIRRLLLALRKAGLIFTQRGAGGGARLTREPGTMTLAEVYRAVEECRPFSPHPHQPNQCCHVGQKIEQVLTEVFASAQAALEQALAQRTLADVLETMSDERAPSSKRAAVRRNPRVRIRRRPDILSTANH